MITIFVYALFLVMYFFEDSDKDLRRRSVFMSYSFFFGGIDLDGHCGSLLLASCIDGQLCSSIVNPLLLMFLLC